MNFVVAFIKTSENVDFSMFKWISVYPLNEINSRFLTDRCLFVDVEVHKKQIKSTVLIDITYKKLC